MQAIARRAGVHHALLHYYFRSKQNLYDAAVGEVLATVWGNFRREIDRIPPDAALEPLLAALLKTHFRVLTRHPDFPLFMFREIFAEGGTADSVFAAALRDFRAVPARINHSLAAEFRGAKLNREVQMNFWINVAGMTVATVLAPRVLKRLGIPTRLTPRFFQTRAETVARTAVRGLQQQPLRDRP